MMESSKAPRILSISGGGIRGIIPALWLRELEERAQRPIHQLFDYVIGTSTGGILALALMKQNPLSAAQCVELFETHGPEIFPAVHLNPDGIRGPRYDGHGLTRVLQTYLGDADMSTLRGTTRVLSLQLETMLPVLVGSSPTTAKWKLWEAARATSAAPTYFPPFAQGGCGYIDGGVVSNNPVLDGVINATTVFNVAAARCKVISLGTGFVDAGYSYQQFADAGSLKWLGPAFDMFMSSSQTMAHMAVSALCPNYMSFSPSVPAECGAMDNVSVRNMSLLTAQAAEMCRYVSWPLIANFLG